MKIVSLFTGAGGLDLGFKQAGFQTVWANEYDKSIWNTFEKNFPGVYLDQRNIKDVSAEDIPNDIVGIIGGPPCQSWSEAGTLRGIEDDRGKLFYDYIRIIRDKQPLFFLAENVSGILSKRHEEAFGNILQCFMDVGYTVSCELLNAHDYGVPQDRKRVIIIGYRRDIGISFKFPSPVNSRKYLIDAVGDLDAAVPAQPKNKKNDNLAVPNHEYMIGGFSTIYMSRNRLRSWNEPSFTIQAGGRHAPLHPQAPKMKYIEKNRFIFVHNKKEMYRRLSVRECARIQTFPDDFIFEYDNVTNGYKMIGNAVPVTLAKVLAEAIYDDLFSGTHGSQFATKKIMRKREHQLSMFS